MYLEWHYTLDAMMDFDRWWNEYNSKSVIDQYSFVMDSFKKGISLESIEEYDIIDILLELKGNLEVQRRFDEIVKLISLVQTEYPQLYTQEFQYFDEFLISYYCFNNQKRKLTQSLDNFIENPIQGIDNFMVALKELLFNDHMDLIDQIIDNIYTTVRDSTEVVGTASEEIALIKFYEHLEQLYSLEEIDKKALKYFRKDLKQYDFKLKDEYVSKVKQCSDQDMITGLDAVRRFQKNWKVFIETVKLYFLKYMLKKNFNFVLSGILWNNMFQYWNGQVKKPNPTSNEFFTIDKKQFDRYLYGISGGMLLENSSEAIATLWGSVYVYDFLRSIHLIDDRVYKKVKGNISFLKEDIFKGFANNLWKSSFIQHWSKPDSISQKEFEEEQQIFLNSYHMLNTKESQFNHQIEQGIKTIDSSSGFHDEIRYDNRGQRHRLKKIGRNDPCPCGSGKKYKKCCGKVV